jgi:predicted amidohydrolase
MTTVACRELRPVVGQLAVNEELALTAIEETPADVLVLPELVTSGYVFDSAEEARACAVAPDHLESWCSAIRGSAVVVAGFAELGADGRVYNSAALLDARGVRAVHRKAHLWDREKLFFAAGDAPAPVIDTQHGRIAVMVCYDLEFPEYTRRAALDGADLIAVPTNWPFVPRPAGERPPEVLIAQAAARVNKVAIACCDRAGAERGVTWTQGTTIVDAAGWVVAGPGGDQTAELDLAAGRDKRVAEHADLFADRRPELYP